MAISSEAFSDIGIRTAQDAQSQGRTNNMNQLGSDDFMELLIAEIQNQDPMEPMDNSDFLAQIATISQVTGLQEMKTSVEDLSSSLVSSQALQAASLIGREVLAPTGLGVLEEGGTIRGSLELPVASSEVTITVYDSAGQIVRRLPLGSQAAGDVAYQWDGLRDDGTYAEPDTYLISAEAELEGKSEAIEAFVVSDVSGVTLNNSGGLLLDIAGVGLIDFNHIKQIL